MSGNDDGRDHLGRAFLAHIAHELRGPSSVTLGALSQLDGETDPERIQKLVAMSRRSVQRVLNLADRLERAGELEAGVVQWEFQPRDVRELVNAGVSAATALEARGGVQLTAKLPDEPCVLPVDGAWVSAAIKELVSTALRNARTSVTLELRCEGGHAVLTIADDGAPPPSIPRRFSAPPSKQTLALALALVTDVADAHGARFTIGPAEGSVAGCVARFEFAPVVSEHGA